MASYICGGAVDGNDRLLRMGNKRRGDPVGQVTSGSTAEVVMID